MGSLELVSTWRRGESDLPRGWPQVTALDNKLVTSNISLRSEPLQQVQGPEEGPWEPLACSRGVSGGDPWTVAGVCCEVARGV